MESATQVFIMWLHSQERAPYRVVEMGAGSWAQLGSQRVHEEQSWRIGRGVAIMDTVGASRIALFWLPCS